MCLFIKPPTLTVNLNDKISLVKSNWWSLLELLTILESNPGTVEWEVNDVYIDKVCR